MARPEITNTPVERAAYTIPEFCEAHRISQATYFALKADGHGPREIHAGRLIISFEAAAEWRREREAKTETATA